MAKGALVHIPLLAIMTHTSRLWTSLSDEGKDLASNERQVIGQKKSLPLLSIATLVLICLSPAANTAAVSASLLMM